MQLMLQYPQLVLPPPGLGLGLEQTLPLVQRAGSSVSCQKSRPYRPTVSQKGKAPLRSARSGPHPRKKAAEARIMVGEMTAAYFS